MSGILLGLIPDFAGLFLGWRPVCFYKGKGMRVDSIARPPLPSAPPRGSNLSSPLELPAVRFRFHLSLLLVVRHFVFARVGIFVPVRAPCFAHSENSRRSDHLPRDTSPLLLFPLLVNYKYLYSPLLLTMFLFSGLT